jgi:hypothetical protein
VNLVNMRTPRNIAWLGGLLEGEGYFTISNGCPNIQLAMTDADVIDRAAAILGVTRRESSYVPKGKDSYKRVYSCGVSGMRALGWMMTLYMFLGERRRSVVRGVIDQWKASKGNLHASPGKRMSAHCHPERNMCAKGLCKRCYMSGYMQQWRAKRKAAAA